MADGCVGLLAGHIAEKADRHSEQFFRYATAHLDRLLTPALMFAVKGALRSVPLLRRPAALAAVLEAQRYADDAAASDAGTQGELFDFFDPPDAERRDGIRTDSVADYFAQMPEEAAADDDSEARRRWPGRS